MAAESKSSAVSSDDEHVTVVIVGDGGTGKSSLCGMLLIANSCLDFRLLQRHRQVWQDHYGTTKPFTASWLMDTTKRERERGMTENGNIALLPHGSGPHSLRRSFTLLDTPGAARFRPKAIAMMAQADAACVCIPFMSLGMEDTFLSAGKLLSSAPSSLSPAQRAARSALDSCVCLYMFNVRQVAFVVTQMDQAPRSMDAKQVEQRLRTLAEYLDRLAQRVGLVSTHCVPVACSSHPVGRNLVAPLSATGEPVVEYQGFPALTPHMMRSFLPQPKHTDGPALIIFSACYRIKGVGTVLVGGVVRGTVSVGDVLLLVPGMLKLPVLSLETFHVQRKRVSAGAQVGIATKGFPAHLIPKHFSGFLVGASDPKRVQCSGDTTKLSLDNFRLSPEDSAAFPSVPEYCLCFDANVLVVRNVVGKRQALLQRGTSLTMLHRLQTVQARVTSVLGVLNKRTMGIASELPDKVSRGQYVRIRLSTRIPVCVQPKSIMPELSRIVLRDNEAVIAAGVVHQIVDARHKLVIVVISNESAASRWESMLYQSELIRTSLQVEVRPHKGTRLSRELLEGAHLLVVEPYGGMTFTASDKELARRFVQEGGSMVVLPEAGCPPLALTQVFATFRSVSAAAATLDYMTRTLRLVAEASPAANRHEEEMKWVRPPRAKGRKTRKQRKQERAAETMSYAEFVASRKRLSLERVAAPTYAAPMESVETKQEPFERHTCRKTAWLPVVCLLEVLGFCVSSPSHLAAWSRISKTWNAACNSDLLWRRVCQRYHVSDVPSVTALTAEDQRLLARSHHKWLFRRFAMSSMESSFSVANGPCGKIRFLTQSSREAFTFALSPPDDFCVLARHRKATGGLPAALYRGRGFHITADGLRHGQVLICAKVLFFAAYRYNKRGVSRNCTLLHNFCFEASRVTVRNL